MSEIPKKYNIDNAKNDIQNLQDQNKYDFQEIKRLDNLIKDYDKRVKQAINLNNQINEKNQYNYENLKKTVLDRIKYLEEQLKTAYEHSQNYHVTMEEVNEAITNPQLGGKNND